MKYIDIHTHKPNSLPDVISVYNIRANHPKADNAGSNPVSYGIHPWDADNADLIKLSDDIKSVNNLIAIGECGLDFKVDVDVNIQKSVLVAHAIIAKELHKPLILHCVKAINDIIDLKKKLHSNVPWIIHGFSGHAQLAEQLIKENFILSFSKSILKESSKSIDALKVLPKGTFFFETDDSPSTIYEIYKQAAVIREESESELIKLIYNQFIDLFKYKDGVE